MNSDVAWLDGTFVKSGEIGLPPLTHSLSYASSVYEGMRSYDGRIFKSAEHLARLRRSAAVFGHTIEYSNEQLDDICANLLRENSLRDAYIKILVFYDDADASFMGRECTSRIVVVALPFEDKPGYRSCRLATASWRRPPTACHPYQAKTSSTYALSYLSFQQKPSHADDVMFLSTDGNVCESSGANLFFVGADVLVTPPAELALDGITRRTVIDVLAPRIHLAVEIRDIPYDEVGDFAGAFLCGTAVEIVEVSAIDDFQYLGPSSVGSIADLYSELVRNRL